MKRIIANPPIGIYTNIPIHLGHIYYLTLLDVNSRFKSLFKNEEVIFPVNSFNLFGKRGDLLFKKQNKSIERTAQLLEQRISTDLNRFKFHLSNQTVLLDTQEDLIKETQKDFLRLNDLGLLLKKNSSYFFNLPKLKKSLDLVSFLDEIKFYPKSTKLNFNYLIETALEEPILLTRNTLFAVPNPLGGDSIGPLFHLANMWNHVEKDAKITMVGTDSVKTKYLFFRYVSQIALNEQPGFDELIIWPKITSEESIERYLDSGYGADILRAGLMLAHSNSNKKIVLNENHLVNGRKLVYLVTNLNKVLKKYYKNEEEMLHQTPNEYISSMDSLRYKQIIDLLFKNLKDISSQINKIRESKNDSDLIGIKKNYLNTIMLLNPIIPYTTNKILKELK